MKATKLYWIVVIAALFILAAGVTGAHPRWLAADPAAVAASLSSNISYQGRLTNPGGAPLDGIYAMRFIVYDADVGGAAVWDSGNVNISVDRGLFNVQLGVDQASFNGQGLWLSIIVGGETLSPRQEILPAPYALSLRPGAIVSGEPPAATDAILDVELTGFWPSARAGGFHAPATGTAVYADAHDGTGVFGDSENSYGIWGSSNNSYGGYFTSAGGHGIRVNTDGLSHYDYGAYVTSDGGYAVYGQSANNQGVRGEAGDLTGVTTVFGRTGVVGMGQNRGVHAASSSGLGIYGTSGNSTGVFGNTDRSDRNYGLYTNDNLFSNNINLAGSIMQVMQNGGAEPLLPGDVVVFAGIAPAETAVADLVIQVTKARAANDTAVAGVVSSAIDLELLASLPDATTALDIIPEGEIASGDYVLVVVQGPALVRATAVTGQPIAPGDLLATVGTSGEAGKAPAVTLEGIEMALPGTVFAKALESLDGSQALIHVYVTLQ